MNTPEFYIDQRGKTRTNRRRPEMRWARAIVGAAFDNIREAVRELEAHYAGENVCPRCWESDTNEPFPAHGWVAPCSEHVHEFFSRRE